MTADLLKAESAPKERTSNWRQPATVLVPAALTLVLGCIDLGKVEPWRDELATWSAAARPVSALWAMAQNVDVFYFPYYLFLHFWIDVFGASAASMRVPSVLAAVGATALVSLLAGRWFDRRAGFCAGVVFALIPMVSRMAQESRTYAFVMFFVALSTWLLLRAVEDPRWPRWVAYGAGMVALGASEVTGLTIVAGHAVYVLVKWRAQRDRSLLRFVIAFVVALVPLVPFGVLSIGQPQTVIHSVPHPTLLGLFGIKFPYKTSSEVWPEVFRSSAVAWVVLGLAVLAVVVDRRRREVTTVYALFFLPLCALWIASQGSVSFYFFRYFVFLLPVAAVAAGVTLAAIRIRPLVGVALLAIAALGFTDQQAVRAPNAHDTAFYPVDTAFAEYSGQYAAYSQLAALIEDGLRPGDAIVYADRSNPWFTDTAIAYYFRDKTPPRDIFLAESPTQDANLSAIEATDYAARLVGTSRVWVVGQGERQDPFAGSRRLFVPPAAPAKVAALTQSFKVSQLSHVSGFTLALMVRR